LAVAFKGFLLDCKARRLKSTTLDWYSFMVTPFLEWLSSEGILDLDNVTPSMIRLYLTGLEDRKLKDTTQHAAVRGIRAFLNFCVNEGWLGESPMRKVRMPKRRKQILPSFTQDEVQRLLGCCTCERDRAVILFLIDTGIPGRFPGMSTWPGEGLFAPDLGDALFDFLLEEGDDLACAVDDFLVALDFGDDFLLDG